MSRGARRVPRQSPGKARRPASRNGRHSGRNRNPGADRIQRLRRQPGLPAVDPARTPLFSDSGHARTAACVSLLLGAGITIGLAGLITGVNTVGPSSVNPAPAVISTSLFCLAMGISIPRRFTFWLCLSAWRRFVAGGRASEMSEVMLDSEEPDPSLSWAVQSVVTLAAGVLMAVLPLSWRGALIFQQWLRTHFVWSDAPLALLQAGTLFVAALLPFTAMGLAVSCAHHVCGPSGRWDTRATAWLSIGAALGLIAEGAAAELVKRPDPTMVVASLPTLIAAIIAASVSARAEYEVPGAQSSKKTLPSWSDHWPLLLRASIIFVGAGSACSILVWSYVSAESSTGQVVGLPGLLAALGIGSLLGCRRKSSGSRSIGGFGVACAGAGVITAACVYGFSGTSSTGFAATHTAAFVGVGAIGFATAYGRQTLLQRVANRTFAGAAILTGLLIACAMTVGVAAPASVHFFGRGPTLMMLGLALLALGGTLIIHEPAYSLRTRRVRLLAVFAALAALIASVVLYPPASAGRSPAALAIDELPAELQTSGPFSRTAAVSNGR